MTGLDLPEDAAPTTSTHRVMDVGGGHVTAATVLGVDGGPGTTAATDLVERSPHPLDSQADRETILATFARAAAPFLIAGAAWTIAMPGPFDYAEGSGTFAGIGKFQALAGLDLRSALAERLDTRPEQVRFLNDAAAYGIGEWAFGSAVPSTRLVCLTLGTGIGSAFVHDGDVVTAGPDVPPDGEAHYIRYRGLPLEDTVSSRAIQARYAGTTGNAALPSTAAGTTGSVDVAPPTVAGIAARALDGDRAAIAVFRSAMEDLGRAIGPWVQRFDADGLVVGGAMSRSWGLLEPGLLAGLDTTMSDRRQLTVRPSTLLDDAPLLGAAVWRQRADAQAQSRGAR